MGKTKNNSKSKPTKSKIPMFMWTLAELKRWKSSLDQEAVKILCDQMIYWASNTEETSFLDLYIRLGMTSKKMQDYRVVYPEIDEAWHFVRSILARRKEKILEKHDPSVIKNTLRVYHDEWKACYDEDMSHKKEQNSNSKEPTEVHIVHK